jgi:hypothetical protein
MTDADVKALRKQVATQHELPLEAMKFLTGTTLAELDQSAATLAKLLGERRNEEPTTAPGPFTEMAAAKAARKQELAAIFTGRAPQPRDERGRFATVPGSFDGGARRQIAPLPRETHAETLTRLLATGEANAGRRI